jgi:hypothetical protein
MSRDGATLSCAPRIKCYGTSASALRQKRPLHNRSFCERPLDQGTRTSDFATSRAQFMNDWTAALRVRFLKNTNLSQICGPVDFSAKPSRRFDARLTCNGHRENSATDCINCLKLPHRPACHSASTSWRAMPV